MNTPYTIERTAQRGVSVRKAETLRVSPNALRVASAPREPWYLNPSFGQMTVFVLVCAFLGFLFGIAMGETLSYDDAHKLVNPFNYDHGKLLVIAVIPVGLFILLGPVLLSEFADGYRIKAKR